MKYRILATILVAGLAGVVTGEISDEETRRDGNGTFGNCNSDQQLQNGLLDRLTKLETMVATSLEYQKSLANQINVLTSFLTELTRNIPGMVPLDPCTAAKSSGVFKLGKLSRDVYCEADALEGGWLVFQQRVNMRLSFYRSWAEFRNGFGAVGNDSDFWVGLEALHQVTNDGDYELAVEIRNRRGEYGFARYGEFRVAGEADKYRLTIGGYSGTAGDALRKLNRTKFSTKDSDNDNYGGNCAADYWTSGWWYDTCDTNSSAPNYNAIHWPPFSSFHEPGKFIRMMIRRK